MSRTPRPKRAARAPAETLHFEDGAHVRALAGPGHANLIALETELGVHVEAPGGGQLLLSGGDKRGRTDAGRVIHALYARAEAGLVIDPETVRAACRMDDAAPMAGDETIIRVPRGVSFAARTPGQADYVSALKDEKRFDMIFGVGPAGTGKTLLAVAWGAAKLARGEIDRLVITRPAVEAGERLGFLPGDLNEKIDPYLLPIWDSLRDALTQKVVDKMREERRIEVAPLAFMRGRTLNNAFIVCDEAQNTTRAQMRMMLTRLGQGSRMAITGDPSQVDLGPREPSGLADALGILSGVPRIAVTRFTRADVVRHDLVGMIVDAYEQADRKHGG